MAQPQIVDVSQLLDARKLTGFSVKLVIFSFLIVFSDGYDISTIAVAAPQIMRAWHVTNPEIVGLIFSAMLVGILFGAPIFGYLGDRFGRKKMIIAACLIYGVFTWATVLVDSPWELLGLRFMCGVGIGALFPNVIAVVAEFAPRRLRATMIVVMFTGVSFGGATPGVVSWLLGPIYGWPILFTLGGIFPILVAIACIFGFPESIRYLVLRPERRADLVRMLAAIRPDLSFAPDTRFVMEDEKNYTGFSLKLLFSDGLAVITPLLWICFMLNLMGYFFLISWTPVLFAAAHIPPTEAGLATTLFQIGGIVGGWTIARPMDLKGMMPVALLYALAVPIIGAIGFVALVSEPYVMALILLSGFCVLGAQFAINAFSGMIYPTSFRSYGSGWAFAVGRIGSVIGPAVGGRLIAMHLPIEQLYVLAALPFVVSTVVCIWMARLQTARLRRLAV